MKKGFTLVELLGVIILLGVIALVITPAVDKTIKKGKVEAFEKTKENILAGAQNWASDNRMILPEKDNDFITITIKELKQEGYLDYELRNPKTKKCISNNVELSVTRKSENFDYSFVGELEDGPDSDCGSVADTPYLFLNGKNPYYLNQNGTYEEPGYSAKDVDNNDITDDVVITNNINPAEYGEYTVKYSVTNSGVKTTKTRKVIVKDNEKPVITFPLSTILDISTTTFNSLDRVTVTDNSGEEITPVVAGNISLGVEGTYYLTYIATDSSGNTNSLKRKIIVTKNPLKYESVIAIDNKPKTKSTGFWGNSKIPVEAVRKIDKVDKAPTTYASKWYIEDGGSIPITAYAVGDSSSGYDILLVSKKSVIYAPEDSSYLFSYIGSKENIGVYEIDLSWLDTSYVKNMSHMFENFGSMDLVSLKLGPHFDTSKVTNMDSMFYKLGSTSLTTLNLGEKFLYIKSNSKLETTGSSIVNIIMPKGPCVENESKRFRLNATSNEYKSLNGSRTVTCLP